METKNSTRIREKSYYRADQKQVYKVTKLGTFYYLKVLLDTAACRYRGSSAGFPGSHICSLLIECITLWGKALGLSLLLIFFLFYRPIRAGELSVKGGVEQRGGGTRIRVLQGEIGAGGRAGS